MPSPPILVSGLINIETTIQVDGFPIPYFPVRYPFGGVNSAVSGVGYNIATALTALGDEVRLLSLIGKDLAGQLVLRSLAADGIPSDFVRQQVEQTAQSAILYDKSGRRQINVDLKDLQEQVYPEAIWEQALHSGAARPRLAALCNINWSRPLLKRARRAGLTIATDVHTIASLDDAYNADFMAAADILFMSDEALPDPPESWARKVLNRYGNEIVVIGLGQAGALLAVRRDNFVERIPAVATRPVVNTIGAGDALFSCFLHVYARMGDPYEAIRQAVIFAGYKIGESGAARGFLDAAGLKRLARM